MDPTMKEYVSLRPKPSLIDSLNSHVYMSYKEDQDKLLKLLEQLEEARGSLDEEIVESLKRLEQLEEYVSLGMQLSLVNWLTHLCTGR